MQVDPLEGRLRALPTHTPTSQVAQAAFAAAEKELLHPDDRAAWRRVADMLVYRALIPGALAGATISYLGWALRAASQLYQS